MSSEQDKRNILWYRSPVSREALAALNQRSDWKGLLQALGHLGLLGLTGTVAWYAAGRLPLAIVLLILFLHGTFFAFLLNAFHELCHQTVFKTKALNTLFLQVISFLSWSNPVMFWASHQEHHKYTLHPPEDLEVVLPQELTLQSFLRSAVVNPWDFYYRLKMIIRLCTRTFLTHPFLRFLYWHMNYHIEHHMYAAVPCYNLGKLHEAIKSDLPNCPVGLLTAWKEILPILKRQKIDPHYQYVAELPAPRAL